MLYYLSQLGDLLQGFTVTKALNVFQYISFRALCAGLTSFLLCLLFGDKLIRHLVKMKLGQPIRSAEEVHRLNELHGGKKGTPTIIGERQRVPRVFKTTWTSDEALLIWNHETPYR